MPKYKLRPEAKADLKGIWKYTKEHWSREQANRYIGYIEKRIEFLVDHPDFGNPRGKYMCAPVHSHYIFYRIVGNNIEIVRVLHQHMDISNWLL